MPLTAASPAARETSAPFTSTVKASLPGSESPSRVSSYVSVSVAPLTAGGAVVLSAGAVVSIGVSAAIGVPAVVGDQSPLPLPVVACTCTS